MTTTNPEHSSLWQKIADAWPMHADETMGRGVPPVRPNGMTAAVIQLAIETTIRELQHPTACDECGHSSDCALHNAPAMPIEPCNCGHLAASVYALTIERFVADLTVEHFRHGLKGYTAEHDDEHGSAELVRAVQYRLGHMGEVSSPGSVRHELVVAASLLWAAADTIDRMEPLTDD